MLYIKVAAMSDVLLSDFYLFVFLFILTSNFFSFLQLCLFLCVDLFYFFQFPFHIIEFFFELPASIYFSCQCFQKEKKDKRFSLYTCYTLFVVESHQYSFLYNPFRNMSPDIVYRKFVIMGLPTL